MSSGGVLFGREAWDPVAIVAQIAAVQCLYYLSLGLLYKLIVGAQGLGEGACRRRRRRRQPPAALAPAALVPYVACAASPTVHTPAPLWPLPAGPYVPELTLHHFFDWRWVSFASFRGWMVSVATFANALLAAFYLRLIVSSHAGVACACSAPGCGPGAAWCAGHAASLLCCLSSLPVHRRPPIIWPVIAPTRGLGCPALPCPVLLCRSSEPRNAWILLGR